MDPFSPVAPARVRVLVVPLGRIRRARFQAFVERVTPHQIVALQDVSGDRRPDRTMFSPAAFPSGRVVYDISTSLPTKAQLSLSTFELFRQPLMILGFGDAHELQGGGAKARRKSRDINGAEPWNGELVGAFMEETKAMAERYPRALVHQAVLFDCTKEEALDNFPDVFIIPSERQSTTTLVKTVMCDLTSILLAEMTTMARSLQALPTLESPEISLADANANGVAWPNGERKDRERKDFASVKATHRMSMPVQTTPRATSPPGSVSLTYEHTLGQKKEMGRSNSVASPRESSPARVSVQGFGPGGPSERERAKGRGRVVTAVGFLYLLAGRWGDALREFEESAAIAKANLDHIWHAKALESILVSLLMIAWAGLEFHIPAICYTHEKHEDKTTVDSLKDLIPDLLHNILALYNRGGNFAGESLPQLPLSETILRYSNLLTIIHLSGLDERALRHIVLTEPLDKPPSPSVEISSFLFKALPPRPNIDPVDHAAILGGMSTVLHMLGLQRKRAFITSQLIRMLIPALVKARKIGAAEAGVHPTAQLLSIQDEEGGLNQILSILGGTYGIFSCEEGDSNELVVQRIEKASNLRSFGFLSLKIEVLWICIRLCEVLPDFEGILQYSTELLRTVGNGDAPGPQSMEFAILSKDEQHQLANNINRTVGNLRHFGSPREAEFWDEFLVRNVNVTDSAIWRRPIEHSRRELDARETTRISKDPFIYNPFLRQPDPVESQKLLNENEETEFVVTVQNPFSFELDIESVQLETSGVDLTQILGRAIIHPYRLQDIVVVGVPKSPGEMSIIGCIVKVRGCRERRFPIFRDAWAPRREDKIKQSGLAAMKPALSKKKKDSPSIYSLGLKVVEEQPLVVLRAMSLSQGAVMILEGETLYFTITIQNVSTTKAVDLLLLSFQDSTTARLQTAMSDKDLSPVELYDLEARFAKKPTFFWRRKTDVKIEPGETATFEIGVLGKPGLTSGLIHADYAHTGVPKDEIPDKFFTRQLAVPISVTVNASVDLMKVDLLPFTGSFSEVSREILSPAATEVPSVAWEENRFKQLYSYLSQADDPRDYCLLLLDLRNSWPSSLQVSLQLSNTEGRPVYESKDILAPGHITRFILPIPRTFLDDPYAPIPSLNPANARQWVVSSGHVNPALERERREAFWYREYVLSLIKASWTEPRTSKKGGIELRGMRFSKRMVEALQKTEVEVKLSVRGESVQALTATKFGIPVEQFGVVQVSILNRLQRSIRPVIRLQPSIRYRHHTASLEYADMFLVNGLLQALLPVIPSGGKAQHELGFCVLARGEFEVSALVEDVDADYGQAAKASNIPGVLKEERKRSWTGREPVIIVAKDAI